MDPRKMKKPATHKQTRSQPSRPVYPQPSPNQFSQPPPNQFFSQPSPNAFSQPSPNAFSQPSPNAFSQSSGYYMPGPPSPHPLFNMAPPPMNTNLYNMARTVNLDPWEGVNTREDVDFVAETQEPNSCEMEDEEDDEEVEEVDARGKKAKSTKKPRETWTQAQEVALARAWIQVSECKKFGNDQKADGFWKRILEHYTSLLGSTSRTYHGLNTKWKTMNAAMGVFNGLYHQAARAKASGCNDLDVMKVALKNYHTKTKKKFGHLEAWEVVKSHDKWQEQEVFQQVGRSSGSGKRKSGDYESASNENVIPDMNEDPMPPVDSRKSKKKQDASSSISSAAEDISSYAQRKQRYLDEKVEKDKLAADLLAAQLDGARFKNRQREMKFFYDSHDHITDPEHLEAVLADKREIGKKNGWRIYFD